MDAIYTHFSKAFDGINQDIFLPKLTNQDVGGPILKWLGRTQCVRINNFISYEISVLSGVPQGSHCGPLIFLPFINDLSKVLAQSDFLMFADDLFQWSLCNGLELMLENAVQ